MKKNRENWELLVINTQQNKKVLNFGIELFRH